MFNLSEEHIQLQQTFREFAENEVKPLAKELDETERFPTETVQKMAEMGMMGLPIPEKLGGSGVDQLGYVLAVEELSKVCATTGIILSAHTSLCCWPIMTFGTEEQKEKYLKPLASGRSSAPSPLPSPVRAPMPPCRRALRYSTATTIFSTATRCSSPTPGQRTCSSCSP